MKKIFGLISGMLIFNSLTIAVRAQSNNSCYMLDGNGKPIDLGYLCQKSNYSRPNRSTRNTYIPQPPQTRSQKGLQVVPIKSRRSGIPVIEVEFNNKYVFEMMLDTGASDVVITQAMANKLRINQIDYVYVSTPSNNYAKMPVGYAYSVGVGKLKIKNPLIITSPTLDMGLLGQSFFGSYDITIKSDVVEFRER